LKKGFQNKHARASGSPTRPGISANEPRHDAVAAGPRLGWREAIVATVSGLGFDLVDVERAQRGLLRVYIDRLPERSYAIPGEFITVEDCEQVTRQLQYALEVEGMDYARLEVSSPGLDRPLRSEADFERFSGQAVSIALKVPFQGRKAWQGVLTRAEPAADAAAADLAASAAVPAWSLLFKQGKAEQVLGFRFEEVREARLVPVVDFKGRKSRSPSDDSNPAGVASDAMPGTDGG
jgi:ribosome maturation factor RimP